MKIWRFGFAAGTEFPALSPPNLTTSLFLPFSPSFSLFHCTHSHEKPPTLTPKWGKIREKHAINTPPRTRYSHHQPQSNRLGSTFAKTFVIYFQKSPIHEKFPILRPINDRIANSTRQGPITFIIPNIIKTSLLLLAPY